MRLRLDLAAQRRENCAAHDRDQHLDLGLPSRDAGHNAVIDEPPRRRQTDSGPRPQGREEIRSVRDNYFEHPLQIKRLIA